MEANAKVGAVMGIFDGLFANTTDAEPQSPHLGPTSWEICKDPSDHYATSKQVVMLVIITILVI